MDARYRYPGANYFKREDAAVFCGRKPDAQKLFTQLMLSKILVMHAESGIGKSSLVQAGLLPLIEEEEAAIVASGKNAYRYITITVRLDEVKPSGKDEGGSILIKTLISRILAREPELTGVQLPFLENESNENLWIIAKKLQVRSARLLIIFDQFEEFQTYSFHEIEYFKKQLSELTKGDMPKNLYDKFKAASAHFFTADATREQKESINNALSLFETPADAKVLFIVREDKLGTMSLLSDYFPDILKNDFTISSLTMDAARDAVIKPGEAEGDFKSPKFRFDSDKTVDDMLEKIRDKETNFVDPFQIQILCSEIERDLVIGKNKQVIKSALIPPIDHAIQNFYQKGWKDVKVKAKLTLPQFDNLKKIVTEELFVNDRRNLFHIGALQEKDAQFDYPTVIETLINNGILRKIQSGRDTFFQLCHDRFLLPVLENSREYKREEEKEKHNKEIEALNKKNKIWIMSLIIFFLVVVGLLLFFIQRQKTNNLFEANLLTILKYQRQTNPTFSYLNAMKWKGDNGVQSDEFSEFTNSFDERWEALLTDRIVFEENLVAVTDIGVDSLEVVDKYSILHWNKRSGNIVKKHSLIRGYYTKKIEVNGNHYYLVINGYTLEIQDAEGAILDSYPASDFKKIEVSADGKYIIIGLHLYEFMGAKDKHAMLPSPKSYKFDAGDYTVFQFVDGSRYLAAGTQNGYIILFNPQKLINQKQAIEFVLPRGESGKQYGIYSIAADRKAMRLFAGNSNRTVEVWDLPAIIKDNPNTTALSARERENRIGNALQNLRPIRVMERHTDTVHTLSLSANDSILISFGSDNRVILWDPISVGYYTILPDRYHQYKGIGTLDHSHQFYSATSSGLLQLWRMKQPSDLYNSITLINSTPFEFHLAELEGKYLQKLIVYDTARTENYYGFLMNYLRSTQIDRYDYSDENLGKAFEKAQKEINLLYNRLLARKDYEKAIPIQNKRLLFNGFSSFNIICQAVIRNANSQQSSEWEGAENLNDIYATYAKTLLGNAKLLLQNPAHGEIREMMLTNSDLFIIADYYRDSLVKYDSAAKFAKVACQLVATFYEKFDTIPELKDLLGDSYGDMGYMCLFTKEYKEAIDYSEKSLLLDRKRNQYAVTNLALGTLLSGDYAKARRIYSEYQKQKDRRWGSFAQLFLNDFEALESAGIISEEGDPIVFEEVKKIRSLLMSK